MTHGENPGGVPVHHDTHAPNRELARLHTDGWFAGLRFRSDGALFRAFLDGFMRGARR